MMGTFLVWLLCLLVGGAYAIGFGWLIWFIWKA